MTAARQHIHPADLVEVAWVPWEALDKGGAVKKPTGRIRGFLTVQERDADGETVHVDGMDLGEFLKSGFITLEHPRGVFNVVGEPLTAERTEFEGKPAIAIEAQLYLHDPIARKIWAKAVAMKRSGASRKLGLSVEGKKVRVLGPDVLESKAYSAAITIQPKNDNARWEPLAASFLGIAPEESEFYADTSDGPEAAPDLARSATAMGYPTQAQPATGAVAPLAPQSLQGVSADAAPPPADPGTAIDEMRRKFLSHLTVDDLRQALICKRFPSLSWRAAERVLADAKGA